MKSFRLSDLLIQTNQDRPAGNVDEVRKHRTRNLTGVVTATDDATRALTLSYSSKKKTETFTGVLQQGCCKVKISDGTVQELKPSQLSPGRRIMVDYISKTTKAEGKKTTVNEIFKVDFLK